MPWHSIRISLVDFPKGAGDNLSGVGVYDFYPTIAWGAILSLSSGAGFHGCGDGVGAGAEDGEGEGPGGLEGLRPGGPLAGEEFVVVVGEVGFGDLEGHLGFSRDKIRKNRKLKTCQEVQ